MPQIETWSRRDRYNLGTFLFCVTESIDFTGVLYGGASRDRTDGLVVANDALSQLSYSPTGRDDGGLPDHFNSVLKMAPSAYWWLLVLPLLGLLRFLGGVLRRSLLSRREGSKWGDSRHPLSMSAARFTRCKNHPSLVLQPIRGENFP